MNPQDFADFSKANQRKLSPAERVKAQTEKHPQDTTPGAPAPEAKKESRKQEKLEK